MWGSPARILAPLPRECWAKHSPTLRSLGLALAGACSTCIATPCGTGLVTCWGSRVHLLGKSSELVVLQPWRGGPWLLQGAGVGGALSVM